MERVGKKLVKCECGSSEFIHLHRTTHLALGSGGYDTYRCASCGKLREVSYDRSPRLAVKPVTLYED